MNVLFFLGRGRRLPTFRKGKPLKTDIRASGGASLPEMLRLQRLAPDQDSEPGQDE